MVTNNAGKFYLKVEKGRKPRVRLFEESRNAQVVVPCDQTTKWPPVRVQMSGGITIIVQRLEQQYKITVQHVMERKPDICVYVNALTHERDIKTCVRDINTQLNHIGVAGPNLEVTGRVKATKVTFESTVGALHTSSKLSARSVILNAQHIFIKPGALFACSKLRMVSRRVQIDGRICRWDQEPSKMSVLIDSALLHIGVDGAIGTSRSSTDKSMNRTSENLVNVLHFRLTGCLANFGRIASQSEMEFRVEGSILSLQDSRIDSASRGYTALKQIKGITSEASDSLPTSSTLSSAILYEKPDTVAQLLEDGVDLNDSVKEGDTDDNTPRKIAAKKYKEMRTSERRNNMREKITLIQALINTHDWRRGTITSNNINAKVGRDCADCAQFRSATLTLIVYGNAKCEANSIWTSGSVTVTVGHDLIIEGQVKHVNLDVSCGGNVATTEEAIVSQEQWVKIASPVLCVAGIWSVGEQLSLDVQSATFLEESYVEVDYFEGIISENCYNSGTWQTRFISLTVQENLFTLHTGKVFVDETAIINAQSFNHCGLWKIKESIKITLKGSANFYASSKFSANLLKLIAEGQCTVAGHLSLENLLAYVRNDMITAAGARIGITIGATVAVGTFRNDSSWHLDGNLHLHVACFEQSEDALIFVKDTLAMAVYDFSEERCQGRIVANYFVMKLAKKARFDCYIRVNQIEICVPHVSESRCTIGGQLEVLHGPLILKGRSLEDSEISASSPLSGFTSPHSYPAFVLEGQLKAEAVIAPFLAVLFSASSYSLLSGMDSIAEEAAYRTLISCSSLHTQRASLIDSVSQDPFPEGILCATTWLHEGQIRFHGDKVYIVSDGLVNRGRLTSGDKLQNHMHEVVVMIENFFRNDAVFSADRIQIRGNGELHNKNRIYASDHMNIRLANFSSDSGQMELENTQSKLLSASKEWTRVGGRIEARGNFDSSASKICMALNRFGLNKQVRISARSQLLVDSDILDDRSNIALAARDAILFKSAIAVDLLELTLGTAYTTEISVNKDASLKTNQLRIAGSCKYLTLVIDGELSCESMVIDGTIRQVKIVGNGILSCRKSCNVGGDSVTLTIRDIRMTELMGSVVTLASDGTLSLSSFDSRFKAVSIYADSCFLQGRIFLEHKIVLKTSRGAVHINGEILGTCADSELCLECGDLILTGTVANLDFLESYTRTRIEHCETGLIKSVKNIVFEAEFISLDGKIMDSESLIATGDEVNIEGVLRSQDGKDVSYSIFGKKILFDGEIYGPARLELNGSQVTLSGTSNSLKFMDIDAKLAIVAPRELQCDNFNLIAYSAILDGNIKADKFGVTVQATIFVRADLTSCMQCKLVAPLVLALNCPVTPKMDICALICAAEQIEQESEEAHKPVGSKPKFVHISDWSSAYDGMEIYGSDHTSSNTSTRTFMQILFHPGAGSHNVRKGHQLWAKSAKAIGDCFENAYATYDELLEALKLAAKMRPVNIYLPKTSLLYLTLLKLLKEIHIEHIAMCNFAKLFSLLCNADIDECKIDTNDDAASISGANIEEQKKFESQPLYEMANRFRIRSHKYESSRTEHRSVEDDVGYASRSSSEDIDDKRQSVDERYGLSLDKESVTSASKLTSDEDDCVDKEIVTDDESRLMSVARVGKKKKKIHGNEKLNDNVGRSKAQDGTRYVLNGERRVPIGYIDFNRLDVVITKPAISVRRKTASNTDLAFKKIQVKSTLPTLELRSFGSESSLASFDERGTPMRYIPTPVKRSLIPRAAAPANNIILRRSHVAASTYDT